jgi:SAM-dependent methyltransferase
LESGVNDSHRPGYDARAYWDEAALQLGERDTDAFLVAGDNTAYYRRKRSQFLDVFLSPAMATVNEVLEVGCGPGGNLAWLARQGKAVAGADVSPEMLALAQHNLPLVEFTLVDGLRLPFADASFEAVMSATVLQHNPASATVSLLAEMARVARSEIHIFEDTAWIGVHDRPSHWLRRPTWYADRLSASGFEMVAKRRLPLAAQETVAALSRAAFARGHREGMPASAWRQRVESAAMPIAQLWDKAIPAGVGLTRMSFRRIPASANAR